MTWKECVGFLASDVKLPDGMFGADVALRDARDKELTVI